MSNPINWLEIATDDLERAKEFYTKVFELDFRFVEMPGSMMYMFGEPDKAGSGGCLIKSDDNKPGTMGALVYFSCDDLSKELERVTAAGGRVVVPKTDIGESGFFAHFIDTEGNKIGLHSMK